ncbi:cysteine hydrolase family protein [Devosia sp. A369]
MPSAIVSSTLAHSVPTSLAEFIPPQQTALVLWDMQKGLAGKASNVHTVRASTRRLIEAADAAGVLVIWSRHLLPPLDLTVGPFLLFLMRKQQVDHPSKLRPFMQAGMEETEFLDGFAPAPHHLVIEKSMPSLFVDTPLDLRLKARGISTIVLAGVATDIGIEFTARHAVASGYYAVVAEDATGAYTEEAHNRSIAFLRTAGPVVSTDEICALWTPPAASD